MPCRKRVENIRMVPPSLANIVWYGVLMNETDFLSLHEKLYELTDIQRVALSERLRSRIWLYEGGEGVTFEHLNELSDDDLECICRNADIEQLAYALLGASEALQGKIRRLLTEEQRIDLSETKKKITPARLSVVERAHEALLEGMQALVTTGKISAISLADPRIDHICHHSSAPRPEYLRVVSLVILAMDDRSVSFLLSKVQETDLAGALLYLQDSRVIRKVMFNLSVARAARLLDDLVDMHQYGLSRSNKSDLQAASHATPSSIQSAFDRFIRVFQELADTGQLAVDLGPISDYVPTDIQD
jgi:flagellar motor switch protein FliG